MFSGKTSRRVHGLQKATARDAATDNRVLRAQIPGQVLRRGGNPGRALGKTERG